MIIIFEVICCVIFFSGFCDKQKLRKQYINLGLITLLVVFVFICALFLSQWLILKQVAVILGMVSIMKLYFDISFKKSMVFSFLYQSLLLLVDYVVYSVNSTLFLTEDLVGDEYIQTEMLVIVLGKITLFLCVLVLKHKFGNKRVELLVDSDWIRFLFFPVFTIVVIAGVTMIFKYVENQMQATILYLIAFGMVIMNVFVYYLVHNIVERETELHEKSLFEIQVKNQMEMYRSISENYEKQKRKAHEFKNHILCIEGLIREQAYEELEKYVGEISEKVISEKNAIHTNHAIVNAILNTKYEEAIRKKIVFVCKVNDLSDIKIADEDIVVMLSNLINNAIEASEKCDERKIVKIKFVNEENDIILSVKNTLKYPVIYENNEIITTKVLSPEEHGIGIKNIIRIVEKYNGSYVINSKEDEFSFSVLFSRN